MKKILIVAMADSVHTARWLEQFENSDDEFVFFPSSPHRRIHPKIVRLLGESSGMKISIPIGLRNTGLILAAIDKLVSNRLRGSLLRRLIRKFQPDILHALETQGAGYVSYEALKHVSNKPFFILTEWGSDFYWFRRFPRHESRLRKLLTQVELLSMECERDVLISRELGYQGKIFPPYPYTGGYQVQTKDETESNLKTSNRKIILIKGHTRFVGRGLAALQAVETLAHLCSDFAIVVYSADPRARRRARSLAKKHGLSVTSYRRGELTQKQFLDIFQKSRIYVGISLSDAASMSLLEAMVCGAFPIQTNTSCADEWIVNGKSGFIVSPDDHAGLVKSIKVALEDDALVDKAAQINYEVARNRLDQSVVAEISKNFYKFVV